MTHVLVSPQNYEQRYLHKRITQQTPFKKRTHGQPAHEQYWRNLRTSKTLPAWPSVICQQLRSFIHGD